MTNPLLSVSAATDLSQFEPRQLEPVISELVAAAERALDDIAQVSNPTYETTLGAIERATEPLELAMAVADHLEGVATTPELRESYNAVLPKVSEFWSRIPLHEGLYRVLAAFERTDEARQLDPTRARFLDKTLKEFRRNGANLAEPEKAKLSQIDQRLAELTNRFSQNVLDRTNAFELYEEDVSRLSGLPESALGEARHSAEQKGKAGYRITLQTTSVVAVLTYADRRELRETIWRALNERTPSDAFDNTELLGEILKLRRERAALLGFPHFADLVLADRMAQSGEQALRFVEELRSKTEPAFERENAALSAFHRELVGAAAEPLEPWDVPYYAEKLRRARYDFDEEALRPYFSAEDVLRGAFELGKRLFGISAVKDAERSAWDPLVSAYQLLRADGSLAAVFYVDLYHRENKRGGAWMHGLLSAVPPGTNVAVLCMNAAPPLGDRPSLLTYRDVETLFHEFGHLLHHCLSRATVRSLSGTRVAHDFVELPSQILENWCAERASLELFAHHYETREPLPVELFERLERVRTFRAANAQMRQLGFAALDLALHTTYEPERDGNILDYARRVMQPYAPAPLTRDYAMVAQFVHLFGHPVGYAAGYYAYKWAEVLDADAFERFQTEGIFNRKTGEDFYEHILAPGDSEDALVLFKRFRGRAPEQAALLRRLGLLETASSAC